MNRRIGVTYFGLALLAAVGVTIYFFDGLGEDRTPFVAPNYLGKTGGDREIPSTWALYRNEVHGLEFRHPPDLQNSPHQDGKNEDKKDGQIEAWSIIDEYNNDKYRLVLAVHDISSFQYIDHSTGGAYIFDTRRNSWQLSSSSINLTQERADVLRTLAPSPLASATEIYEYHGGNGYCVWNSYLIPLHAKSAMVELEYNVCGAPPSDEDIALHEQNSDILISSLLVLEK